MADLINGLEAVLELREMVKQTSSLASLPDACIRLNEMFDDPHYSTEEMGEVLIRDPALSAQVLKIVNSAFYCFMSSIDTVSRAITIIGMNDFRSLVLAASATRSFNRLPNDLVSMDAFWTHSLFTAAAARLLAVNRTVVHPESLFVAGLLHDIGHLMLYRFEPKQMMEVLLVANDDLDLIAHEEQVRFGFTYADAGAALLGEWKLPRHLIECVKFHQNPEAVDTDKLYVHIIHLASRLSAVAERGESLDEVMATMNPVSIQALDIGREELVDILEQIPGVYTEARNMILPAQTKVEA